MRTIPLSSPATAAQSTNPLTDNSQRYFWYLLATIAVFTLYRVIRVATSDLSLFEDEIQYWDWANNLDLGYYSKPPMLAWFMALVNSIFGDATPLAVRASIFISYPLTTLVIYSIGREHFSRKTGMLAGIIFFTLPAVFVGNVLVTTDSMLFLFWALTFKFFIRAVSKDQLADWLLTGLFAGCGLLSKYSMSIFAAAALIYVLMIPEYRRHLRNPKLYFGIFVAAAVFAPNIWWNIQNDFITFQHHVDISNGKSSSKAWRWDKMGEFVGAQVLMFGVVALPALLLASFNRALLKSRVFVALLVFCYAFLAIISLQSIANHAYANWAAPFFVTGSLALAAWLTHTSRQTLARVALAFNIALGVFMYHYRELYVAYMNYHDKTVVSKYDPTVRLRGWDQFGDQLSSRLKAHPDHKLLVDRRNTLTAAMFYARDSLNNGYAFWQPPKSSIQNHYALTAPLKAGDQTPMLFVATRFEVPKLKRFESVTQIKGLKVQLYPDRELTARVYSVRGFKGYDD